MGWNDLDRRPAATRCWPASATGDHAYFVHSYQFRVADPAHRLALLRLWRRRSPPSSARDNIVGTQFHPEKSQAAGLRLIANFLRWKP